MALAVQESRCQSMKTVIAVSGKTNCGKTMSIFLANELLLREYPHAVVEKFGKSTREILQTLSFDGVKIGIESEGKPGGRMRFSLMDLAECNCDVIICATRSMGDTVEAAASLGKSYNVRWLYKQYADDRANQEAENLAMAKQIVKLVREALGK